MQLPATCTFVGYDVSPQAIELSRPKVNGHLRFELGMPSREEHLFDLILLIDVIEHVRDCWQFLEELRPLARYKILHVPLDLSAQGVMRRKPLLQTRRQVGHIHYFTAELAVETLAEAGYRVIDSFHTLGSVELPARLLRTKVARLPRRLAFSLSPELCARVLGGCSLMLLAE